MSEIGNLIQFWATLFGAGRSMSVTELCDFVGDEDEMLDCLYSLRPTLKDVVEGAYRLQKSATVGR